MLFVFSALIFLLPLASALTLNLPTVAINSAGPVTITWTTAAGDPANFDLRLVNAAYHNTFALSASVIAATGSITLNLPAVQPEAGYALQATVVSNVNAVLSTTGTFAIAAPLSTTASLGSTTGSLSSTTSINSNTATTSGTTSSSTPSTPPKSFNGASSSVALNGFTGAFAIAAAAAGAALAGY